MNDTTVTLLKELTEAHGVPGYETEVRALVRRYLEPLGTIEQDRIGSLICRQGDSGPRVMLAGHMDEIGFMVHHITKEGFLRFVPLGGWWDQVLLGQRVIVKTHKGDIPGVIGAKPPHLLPQEERNKVVEKKEMYIDIGATSQEEVEALGVRLGDPVVPDAPFRVMASGKVYLGKAFDDRVGVALMIEALRHFSQNPHPNILYGVATVMEEVGTRGAKTSAEVVNPDVAIILESDICGDVPGIKPEESSVKLGGGPTLVPGRCADDPQSPPAGPGDRDGEGSGNSPSVLGPHRRRHRRRHDSPARDRGTRGGAGRPGPTHPQPLRNDPSGRL